MCFDQFLGMEYQQFMVKRSYCGSGLIYPQCLTIGVFRVTIDLYPQHRNSGIMYLA